MFIASYRKIMSDLKRLKQNSIVKVYIRHNKKVFGRVGSLGTKAPVVLMELNSMHSSHIAYAYLANVLAMEYNARVVGYAPRVYEKVWQIIAFKIIGLFGLFHFGVYKSFGAVDFFSIEISAAQKKRALSVYGQLIDKIKDKREIEALTIDGVLVGDLIYDTYLARFKRATVDQLSQEFRNFLLESIEQFVFWKDYFDKNDIRAINVSHCVYNIAIPLRLAVEKNIPAFQASITHLYRMSKKDYFAYNDFFYFREQFAALPEGMRTAGMEEAKRRIERRFAGEVGVDMSYSTKSAYGTIQDVKLLKESNRKKILIATHCFFDSPHSYGNNIFPDFYEWIDFLGRMSEVTEYDWYIKTHPDYLPGTMEVILDFIKRYPRFTLLPAEASHHQIIAEGIDVALTVYGTIAFEYAALGIPVINNSLNNPHIAYNFNLHSMDVEDYRRLLLDLNNLDLAIDKMQVYEYYFMRFIFNTADLFFDSYDSVINELGGYSEQFTSAIYGKWMQEWTLDKHRAIISALQIFIRSGDYRMNYRHFGRELTVDSVGAAP